MMTEQEIKSEARLTAIEYMVAHAVSIIHVTAGVTDEHLDALESDAKVTLGTSTFPGVDPAVSDLLSAEIQESIERLLSMSREMTLATHARIKAFRER